MTTMDQRNDAIFDLIMDAWDVNRVLTAFEAHYQRGIDAGKALAGDNAEQLKAEFERGRESYRDELFEKLGGRLVGGADRLIAEGRKPIAHSIEEKPAPIKSVAIAKPPAEKNLGGKPNKSERPENLPRNIGMALEAIKELGGKASAPQILGYIRQKWWAGFPSSWTAVLYDLVKNGTLARDGINFIAPVAEKVVAPTVPAVQEHKPRVPEPGNKLGPPARAEGVMFRHGGETVTLHAREAAVTEKLYAARGKGHVDARFLAGLIGIKSEADLTMQEFVKVLNPKIAPLGLTVEFFKGFGFLMKDAPANG